MCLPFHGLGFLYQEREKKQAFKVVEKYLNISRKYRKRNQSFRMVESSMPSLEYRGRAFLHYPIIFTTIPEVSSSR
jgi:hypothetical protein